uniref:NADH-ubiquinone oxidoreductase chain 6 n=1 Tax=Bolbometopon muricatum TaxID=188110 RepID=A0A1P8LFZ3_BOLMU|nr:NADH dehydrogenase subunit 6 [Bolbometopon muricatum]APW83538.1 NADH dehydrogenase subunit 6 [Bolbometopon muricatum]
MSFLVVLFTIGLVLGLVGVASNPSPYFAALALVVVAWAGCGLLTSYGGCFLALVLFLIYLGGMLVVFAYSSALAAEIYPEAWLRAGAGFAMYLYTFVMVCATLVYLSQWEGGDLALDGVIDWSSPLTGDMEGVALMYLPGGGMLILSVWVLLLTLFVILELVRGLARGTIRAV